MRHQNWFQITPTISLEVWYDRQSQSWWAGYFDASETPAGVPVHHQIGDAWFGPSRDYVLVHRPSLTTVEV